MKSSAVAQLEERTARLTILIDPRKKAVFERLCAQEDLSSSQVVRRLIRGLHARCAGNSFALTPGDAGKKTYARPKRDYDLGLEHGSGREREAESSSEQTMVIANRMRSRNPTPASLLVRCAHRTARAKDGRFSLSCC
jgi:hypothetical protein